MAVAGRLSQTDDFVVVINMIAANKEVYLNDEVRYINKGPFLFEEIIDVSKIFQRIGEEAYIIKPSDNKKTYDYSISIKIYQLMKKLCMPFVIILINHDDNKQIGFIVPHASENFTNEDIKDGLDLLEKHKLIGKLRSVNEYMENTGEIGDICGYRVARGPMQEKQMRINGEMIIK